MSDQKKMTVNDLVNRMDKIQSQVEKVSQNLAVVKERNEYLVLRCEGLLKVLLNADKLPDLSAKPEETKTSQDDKSASDLFGSDEVPI